MALPKKNWITLLLALVVVGAYYALVFLPKQHESKRIKQEMIQMRNYITSTLSLPISISETNENLTRCDHYVDEWHQQTPTLQEIPRVFAEINKLARQTGVVTTRFDPEQAERMQVLSKVPLTLGITGSFEQIVTMLRKLERLKRPIWIERIQIDQTGRDREDTECELKLIVFADNSE